MHLSKNHTFIIKNVRKKLNLSQEKVAYELNMQQNIYSKIERGTQSINKTKLDLWKSY